MITNYEELPNTSEGLKFYINASLHAIKDYTIKARRLEELLAMARERLRNIESAPKNEVMDEPI